MSTLTATLMKRPSRSRHIRHWNQVLRSIADRLHAVFGAPRLGNSLDPVNEIFYIMLSARTTDAQYRRTHSALRAKFPTLDALANAKVSQIVRCIASGGLANKRAAQARRLAAALLRCGTSPSRYLRALSAFEAFEFLTGLPGMGPKSALCVMMYSLGFDVLPVDVNVQRVAARVGAIPLGLQHYQAQQILPPLVPAGRSKELHVGMVILGRQICLPRNPRCGECPIRNLCSTGRKRGTEMT